MKKITLKDINQKRVKQLSREQLKSVMAGDGGWDYGSGGSDCDENAEPNPPPFTGCKCKSGYYFSAPFGRCVEGSGSAEDPNPKITACAGSSEGTPCSYTWQGQTYSGYCRYRFASELYCSDTLFV